MKYTGRGAVLIGIGWWLCAVGTEQPLTMNVVSIQHAKVKLVVGIVGEKIENLIAIARVIQQDFMIDKQFDIDVMRLAQDPKKKDIQQLYKQGYSLALFLNRASDQSNETKSDTIEWRVYDTMQSVMIQGKKYIQKGTVLDGWAHNIADMVWPVLTGNEGIFSTKIAYCKDTKTKRGKLVKHICISDIDGRNEQILIDMPTVSIAPRWNNDSAMPLLFYSEYTNANVRLMVVNMHKKRRIASNFQGINMLPVFSGDGTKMVYCASRGDGNCQLYYHERGIFKQLTFNNGANVSPTISKDGRMIYFCSDFQTGLPQIYRYMIDTGTITCITDGGYCASPCYSDIRKQVVYSKIVNGIMQLFLYDEIKQTHTQLTTDEGNKEEASWSPGGTHLVFSVERGEKSRIVIYTMATKALRYLTQNHENCSYPTWSPLYEHYPIVS